MREEARRTSVGNQAEVESPLQGLERWWRFDAEIRALPPAVRELAERLAGLLLCDDEEATRARGREAGEEVGSDEVSAGLAEAWRAVVALRRSILLATENGAPRSAVELLHRRLDREALGLAREALGQCVLDSRSLVRDVSHDLRSPLNSVLFLADTLLSEQSGELNPVQRRQVGVLYTAAVTLVGLVNDLIDASRLGEGVEIATSHVSFSMESVLSDVKSLLGPLASHRGVALRFHMETVGARSGDRQLLSRVLINLVTNAIQAVAEEGEVRVSVSETPEGWLRIEVSDDGDSEDLLRLRSLISAEGDPYTAGRTRGWTHGLGLSISARLVRAAGGTLEVDRTAASGTRFSVELPYERIG